MHWHYKLLGDHYFCMKSTGWTPWTLDWLLNKQEDETILGCRFQISTCPSMLDHVLFQLFWMVFFKQPDLFRFRDSYSPLRVTRNVVQQSATKWKDQNLPPKGPGWSCHPKGRFNDGIPIPPRQSNPPKGTAGDSSQAKSITVSWSKPGRVTRGEASEAVFCFRLGSWDSQQLSISWYLNGKDMLLCSSAWVDFDTF